jgi:hypothetical protein
VPMELLKRVAAYAMMAAFCVAAAAMTVLA